jgi:hypothetical protein
VVGLVAVALGTTGVGVALAGPAGGSMTVTRDGAVIEGQAIRGYVYIKANNVTIRNSTIRYDGDHVLRVFDGSVGTVIESTKIYCQGDRTNGIVYGNYAARRVEISGCRNGFVYSSSAPATIVDSTWNGRKVMTGAELGPAPAPAPSPARARAGSAPRAASGATPTGSSAAAAAGIPAGYPGPDNTGVPAGTKLKRSGSLTLSKAGQVVSGLDIAGCVTVTAKDVIIQKSRITCGSPYSIKTTGAKNLVVQDVEINGLAKNTAAVCCSDYSLRRVEIWNVIDGPRLSDNTVIEQSWIHHLVRVGASHNDALQTTGASNIVVRGNSLEVYNPTISDPLNACLMIGSTTGPIVSNLLFERNYCNGGNYSIGIRTDLNAANIKIQNNAFGHDYRFGIVARPAYPGILWQRPTNIWADNRKPVVG